MRDEAYVAAEMEIKLRSMRMEWNHYKPDRKNELTLQAAEEAPPSRGLD